MSAIRPKLACALLLAAFALQSAVLIRRVGVAYDEPAYLGAAYWYPNFGLGFIIREHPPFFDYVRSLALAILEPSAPRAPAADDIVVGPFEYGQRLLFFNRVPWKDLLTAGRLATLASGLLLGVVLWAWSWRAAGPAAAAWTLLYFAFDPNLLAHASLATNDAPVTAFMALALCLWAEWMRSGRTGWAAGAGLAAGIAAATKLTGMVLGPILAAAELWPRPLDWRRSLLRLGVAALAGSLAVLLVYSPGELHRFFDSLAYRSKLLADPAPTFLLGCAYPEGQALFYPMILLLKTTPPSLALALAGLFWREAWPRTADRRLCLWACAALMASALLSRRQHGVRYLLPLYPVMFLAAGAAAARFWAQSRKWRWLALIAGGWHATASLHGFPHHLAFASVPLAPHALMGESNVDWGQGLPELVDFLRERPGGVILSYFGMDCPQARGLKVQEAFCTPGACSGSSAPLPADIGAEWLVVGATKWQGFYEKGPPAWGWLHARAPDYILGRSLLVYDVSRDPPAHRELASMYDRANLPAFAKRERARAAFLEGKPR